MDDFCAHIEDAGFFRRFGNPVVIQSKGKPDVVCMAWECYERIRTNYWIMELEMPDEIKDALETIAKDTNMTFEEFSRASFVAFIEYVKNNPNEVKALIEEGPKPEIKVARVFSVFYGETEEEARSRALAFEESKE